MNPTQIAGASNLKKLIDLSKCLGWDDGRAVKRQDWKGSPDEVSHDHVQVGDHSFCYLEWILQYCDPHIWNTVAWTSSNAELQFSHGYEIFSSW